MNISNPFLFLPFLPFSRSNTVHRKRRGIEKAGFSIIQTHYIRAKKSILFLREFLTCPTRQKNRKRKGMFSFSIRENWSSREIKME